MRNDKKVSQTARAGVIHNGTRVSGSVMEKVDSRTAVTPIASQARRERKRAFIHLFGKQMLFLGSHSRTGSDLTWQAEAAFGIMVTKNVFGEIGYRALGVDYDKDGFQMDTITHGFQLGLGLIF